MNPQKARITIGSLTFLERSVQPPSVGLTGKLDTSSSANAGAIVTGSPVVFKTYIPSLFAEAKDITAEVLYSTAQYSACLAQIGVEQNCLITFADATSVAFRGWLADFDASQEDTVDATGSAKATIIIHRSGGAIV